MHSGQYLVVLLFVGLWSGFHCFCGSQLQSAVNVDIPSPTIIKKIWINSIYPWSVEMGDQFQVRFTGTDAGTVDWATGPSEVTMLIASDGVVLQAPASPVSSGTKTPVDSKVVSFSSKLTVSWSQMLIAVFGILGLRYSTKVSAILLVVALCLSSLNVIQTTDQKGCDNTSAVIYVPSGKAWMLCDQNNGTCVCGPDYSGPNCNYYKSKCITTSQQWDNRMNYNDVMPVDFNMPLPEPGESFCDPNFGTEIWRVSNHYTFDDQPIVKNWIGDTVANLDQRVNIIGSVGFSPGLSYAMGVSAIGGSFVYEVNIDEYNIPHINPNVKHYVSMGFIPPNEPQIYNYVTVDSGRGAWMTDQHFVFVYYDQVFMFDMKAPKEAQGGMYVHHIGNLTQFLINNYYSGPLDFISRCSAARIRPDGSLRLLCDIGYDTTGLKQPDYTQVDSHSPHATCINAPTQYGGAKIGYIVFDILSPTPADPQANIKLFSKFVNGVDSDDWYCWQSALQWSSALNDYRLWIMWNGNNNGYKQMLDRSGEWITCQAINVPDLHTDNTVGEHPTFKVKLRPYDEGGGWAHSVVHDYEGHGPYGWAQSMNECGYSGEHCKDFCLCYFNFTSIPDDDPKAFGPTASIAPRFDNYENGKYGSYHHATPTNKGEAIFMSGCDITWSNCSAIPRSSEILRLIPDPVTGSGTVERILSTRDTSNTQYAVITSPCEDDDGPCWVLFQSTWGLPRSKLTPWVPVQSDLFIARFR